MMRQMLIAAALLTATSVPTTCPPTAAASPTFPGSGSADYQLGQAYTPAAGVTLLVRDSTASPVAGLYNICYVNGFQTQPGDRAAVDRGLVLADADGDPVVDPDWPDEFLLDTSTPANRDALVALLTPTLRTCADKGFQAVEFDNLDSFTRSRGALTADDNLAFAGQLIGVAHGMGLQVGQKNAAEYTTAGRAAGFDFAIAEECAQYDECGSYTSVYGTRVVDVEYTDNLDESFAQVCAAADRPAMTILRDRYLVAPGQSGYTYDTC